MRSIWVARSSYISQKLFHYVFLLGSDICYMHSLDKLCEPPLVPEKWTWRSIRINLTMQVGKFAVLVIKTVSHELAERPHFLAYLSVTDAQTSPTLSIPCLAAKAAPRSATLSIPSHAAKTAPTLPTLSSPNLAIEAAENSLILSIQSPAETAAPTSLALSIRSPQNCDVMFTYWFRGTPSLISFGR